MLGFISLELLDSASCVILQFIVSSGLTISYTFSFKSSLGLYWHNYVLSTLHKLYSGTIIKIFVTLEAFSNDLFISLRLLVCLDKLELGLYAYFDIVMDKKDWVNIGIYYNFTIVKWPKIGIKKETYKFAIIN